MRKLRMLMFGLLCATILMVGVPVSAQHADVISGGSNAADYQPPTDNPQGNVRSGLQNTTSGLQPVPGQNSFTQEKLSGAEDLKVNGATGDANKNTTSIPPAPKDRTPLTRYIPHVVIGTFTLWAVVKIMKQPSDTLPVVKTRTVPEIELKPEPLPKAKPKKTKKKTTKKPAKKRKK